MASILTFEDTHIEIHDRQGARWMTAKDLAAALEYADERAIHKIYQRNADEFTDQMSTVVKLTTVKGEKDTRVFSFRGAHLIAMLAKSERAKAFRQWVLDLIEKEAEVRKQIAKAAGPVDAAHINRIMHWRGIRDQANARLAELGDVSALGPDETISRAQLADMIQFAKDARARASMAGDGGNIFATDALYWLERALRD